MQLAHQSYMQEQSHILPFALSLVDHFAGSKHQYDSDDDSGMGPSIFIDTKSTTLSEVSHAPQSCSKLFKGAVAMVIKSCLCSLCMQLGWCGDMLHPHPFFFFFFYLDTQRFLLRPFLRHIF